MQYNNSVGYAAKKAEIRLCEIQQNNLPTNTFLDTILETYILEYVIPEIFLQKILCWEKLLFKSR